MAAKHKLYYIPLKLLVLYAYVDFQLYDHIAI